MTFDFDITKHKNNFDSTKTVIIYTICSMSKQIKTGSKVSLASQEWGLNLV